MIYGYRINDDLTQLMSTDGLRVDGKVELYDEYVRKIQSKFIDSAISCTANKRYFHKNVIIVSGCMETFLMYNTISAFFLEQNSDYIKVDEYYAV